MNFTYFRDTKVGIQLVVLLLGCLLMTIISSSLMLLAGSAGVDVQNTNNILWFQLGSQVLSFLLTSLLFVWAFYGNATSYLRLDFSLPQWGRGGVAVIILLLLLPVIDWVTVWNDGMHLPQSLSSLEDLMRSVSAQSEQLLNGLLTTTDPARLALNLLVIALCPAICEEVFFRGVLQQVLSRWFKNPHWAIIVATAVFSVVHGEVFAFVPRFLLGVVLGYLFYLSGSLLVNVCAHFVNNALIVVLYFLYSGGTLAVSPDEPIALPWLLTVLCFAAAACLFYIYFVKKRSSTR